ncbi:complex I NDUFA9 subunit family protein [Chitinolyticbacter meiyuanensis]|uniref:complex I NDUFA9 subunit family protein n=1 Tax=Chitinolyticbacter meiyuanensis TaxID=682798 RepID=UPI001651F248|nr:complex I NDUFA9 subunit family protein [Chitinolyticbacter meiyuanensis]
MTSNVLLIGGSGFIGRQIAAQLADHGHTVTIPSRNREAHREQLLELPGLTLVEANVHDSSQLAELVPRHDAVVNLVGILQGSTADFERVHVKLTERIVNACAMAGVRRYLHMSALGADVNGPSRYQRSKGDGEAVVRASGLAWTIYRPSVVFGRGDSFLTVFAALQRLAPCVPLASSTARFQPVWVGDVARAFVTGIEQAQLAGHTLYLVGPRVYTLAELVRYAGRVAGHRRLVFGLPDWAARLQASAMQLLPNPPLSHDNLDSMKVDNVHAPGFAPELGWTPTALEAVAPGYLGSTRRFDTLRQHAHTPARH